MFTLEEVIEATKQVVADAGPGAANSKREYVKYLMKAGTLKARPCCIVAHVVERLSPVMFEEMAKDPKATGLNIANVLNLPSLESMFTWDAIDFLFVLQNRADSSTVTNAYTPWTDALASATSFAA